MTRIHRGDLWYDHLHRISIIYAVVSNAVIVYCVNMQQQGVVM